MRPFCVFPIGLATVRRPLPPFSSHRPQVTLTGGSVVIKAVGSEAVVTKPDIPVCKGVVHVIDEVSGGGRGGDGLTGSASLRL